MKIVQLTELSSDFIQPQIMNRIDSVRSILDRIRLEGDPAVRDYSRKFDQVELEEFRIGRDEIMTAHHRMPDDLKAAVTQSACNIRRFAQRQFQQFENFEIEIEPGVVTGQRVMPLQRVGVYVPGGRFPLISSVLMGVIPAQVAGVEEIMVCSPPGFQGSCHPHILAAAHILGITEIYRIGGVQAIGAMAYGTHSIRRVNKIVGPGNQYVAQAKKEVYGSVGIDFIAGPSEIMIIADASADPDRVAADILSQAEHDVDASAILITDSQELAEQVQARVDARLAELSTRSVAMISLERNSLIILVRRLSQAVEIANLKAPEHLELQVKDSAGLIPDLKNFGSLFIGSWSTEPLGDYSSGLNHTLPTNQSATYTGGLSVKDFIKLQTYLKCNAQGIRQIGRSAVILAEAEGLSAHAEAVRARL
ncbi:MAG: histidinol dehydrogenase [Candidatus Delongbacteria bacterium]|nr:histidinol dehydrogenase [Candidatus Delongbacteria bacterium]